MSEYTSRPGVQVSRARKRVAELSGRRNALLKLTATIAQAATDKIITRTEYDVARLVHQKILDNINDMLSEAREECRKLEREELGLWIPKN